MPNLVEILGDLDSKVEMGEILSYFGANGLWLNPYERLGEQLLTIVNDNIEDYLEGRGQNDR